MNSYTVVTENIDQFAEVLKFYGKDSTRFGDNKYGKCRLYIVDNKYSGWDSYKNNSHLTSKEVSFVEWIQLTNPTKLTTKSESTMKYVVEVNNLEELNAVRKHVGGSNYTGSSVVFPWCVNGITGSLSNKSHYAPRTSEYGPILVFKDWALMFGVELKPNKTLKLTTDYTAEVNYNTKIVQVGCQSIPFATVEVLAKLIKE